MKKNTFSARETPLILGEQNVSEGPFGAADVQLMPLGLGLMARL
jgi:hypothetical protein